MLSNRKSKFYLLIARLYFHCLLPVNGSMLIDVQCNTWLFKINPVNGLAFVRLSFHFMMQGSSYKLSNYQFAES